MQCARYVMLGVVCSGLAAGVAVSLVAIAFGDCFALHSALRSILSRSCPSVRCVVVSNLSGSNAISLVERFTPRFGKYLH